MQPRGGFDLVLVLCLVSSRRVVAAKLVLVRAALRCVACTLWGAIMCQRTEVDAASDAAAADVCGVCMFQPGNTWRFNGSLCVLASASACVMC